MAYEAEYRETVITFDNDDLDFAVVTTTYPYIAKQLSKEPDAKLIRATTDPKSNVEDSWEYKVPITWFFAAGRLRWGRKLG